MSISTDCRAAGHLATSIWTSRISYEDVASLLSTLSVCVVLMRFYSFNFNNIEHKIISSLSNQLSLRITQQMSNELISILSAPTIKRHLKLLVTISMTKNARRLNDELLNSSNGLLRSASSPGIASAMLMRFYPIITRCNEPLEAAHEHIDGMSCRGPPRHLHLDLSDQLRRCSIASEHAISLRSPNALLFFQLQ